ncbi:MAG: FAD-dependent oxidoreductase [Thermoleophilia bacterium]|nr:FAD-dependent oxidoreductase [Thermoleophilia bacterium]
MRRLDAIVVGAGVAGSAAARALGARGAETVLFEQYVVGHRRGSSHGATRMFRLAYPDPDYVRLARRARESWRELEAAAGEELLVTTGGLYAGGWAEACGAALAACGVSREWLPAGEAEERFPGIAFDGLGRVLYQADGGVCLADRAVAAQVRLARESGVEVREAAEVTRFAVDDRGIAITSGEETVHAPVAVIAAGPWAGDLLFELGIDLPLRPSFAQVTYFDPREPGVAPPPCFVEAELGPGVAAGGYWVPGAGGARLKAGFGAPGRAAHPSLAPFHADPGREARDAAWLARRLPSFDPAPVATETCVYTMTPDEDFVLERVGPVVVASACSGHGFKFGPLLGEILAALALGDDPGIPAARFSTLRPSLAAARRPGR